MTDFQTVVFKYAIHWGEATGAVLFLVGILCMLQGFRFLKAVLVVTAAGGAFFGGAAFGEAAEFDPFVAGCGAALATGAISALRSRFGLFVASAVVCALFVHYTVVRLGLKQLDDGAVLLAGAAVGLCMPYIAKRSLPLLLTTFEGVVLVILGFVTLSAAAMPGLAQTFLVWASSFGALVPAFMLALFVLGYSVQANSLQGDIVTGGAKNWTPDGAS